MSGRESVGEWLRALAAEAAEVEPAEPMCECDHVAEEHFDLDSCMFCDCDHYRPV